MRRRLDERMAELAAAGLLRDPDDAAARSSIVAPDGAEPLDACSNDYLGLGAVPVSRETMDSLSGSRPGAGASRLVQGEFAEHTALEAALAAWTRNESALLTSSAFAANLGLLPALGEAGSLIVSDELNHASIVDGCRLARADVVVTPHDRVEAIESALRSRAPGSPAWVVVEGLFSMDGDSPDVAALRAVCDRYDAGLILDEAHSLGVLGPSGAGAAAAAGVAADALVAGLGKAVGVHGGFVAGSDSLRRWVWNRARPFVFSTAPSPLLCRLVLAQVAQARSADAARARLATLSQHLRESLRALGLDVRGTPGSPIVPLVLGSNELALRATQVLRSRGILAQAIRPPTVPVGAARLRLTVHADWPNDAVARLTEAIQVACAS